MTFASVTKFHVYLHSVLGEGLLYDCANRWIVSSSVQDICINYPSAGCAVTSAPCYVVNHAAGQLTVCRQQSQG